MGDKTRTTVTYLIEPLSFDANGHPCMGMICCNLYCEILVRLIAASVWDSLAKVRRHRFWPS